MTAAADVRALLTQLDQAREKAWQAFCDDPGSERFLAPETDHRACFNAGWDAALPRLTSALRQVLDLADQWDTDHADWCCTKGCVYHNARHTVLVPDENALLGVRPDGFTPCTGECTCEVGPYRDRLRSTVAAALATDSAL